jgi:hypothetical protein
MNVSAPALVLADDPQGVSRVDVHLAENRGRPFLVTFVTIGSISIFLKE